MRICLLGTGVQPIPPTGYGGVERTIAEYARALHSAGHEVTVLNEVRKGRSRDEYLFALHVPRRLRGDQFDVLHASTPVVANRLAWSGLAYVYTTHSRHWFERSAWNERWGAWLERRAVRRAAATVALTARLATRIATETAPRPPRRLETIPIGVDTDRFHPAWELRTGRRALGVGVVRPFKRWELAAEALRGTGFELTIAGPVPDPEYARRVVAAGESVHLLGEVDDPTLQRLYGESDILVHPSRVELLAGVVLQGLAASLPVLGAAPVNDLIEEGRTGFRGPASDDAAGVILAFHEAARTLAGDPARRRTMGEAARVSAIERFSWQAVVQRHLALYASLIEEGSLSRRLGPSR